jgi:hypothetical protein
MLRLDQIPGLISDLTKGIVSEEPQTALVLAALVALPVVLLLAVLIVAIVYTCDDCCGPSEHRKRD